ncbi:MAG: DUF1360 domain-containing protein [Candidatus Korobacteraceae bacterium]
MNSFNLWARLVVAVLATWRVTHLLANEDGPADIIVRFRKLLGRSLTGQLMDCFNCLSLWIAALAALFVSQRPLEWLMSWLAVSGGACLLERLGREPVVIQPQPEVSEGDSNNVLWTEPRGSESSSDTNGESESRAERTH